MSIADIRKQDAASGPLVRAYEAWHLKNPGNRAPDGYWHPSGLAGCPTACFYSQMGFPAQEPPVNAQVLRIFGTGSAIHQMLQHHLVQAGLVPEIEFEGEPGIQRFAVEVPFTIESMRMKGSLDAIYQVAGKRGVLEAKSKHSMSFAKLSKAEPQHRFQATCYVIAALERKWIQSPHYTVLYWSKDDSKLREFPYVAQDSEIQMIKDKAVLLNQWAGEFKEHAVVPTAYYKEPTKPPCRTCPWATVCHSAAARQPWLDKIKGMTNAQAAPAQAAPQAPAQARRLPPLLRRPARPA